MTPAAGVHTPIFVMAGSDVLAFQDLARAEAYLEPIDVRAGEYTAAFDAAGRYLRIDVESGAIGWPWRLLGGHVERVRFVATDEVRVSEFTEHLRTFLDGTGVEASDRQLAELVSLALERALIR
jgi:hypothetical protein